VFRAAAAAGNDDALGMLAAWLSRRPADVKAAEAGYREAAAAGDPDAMAKLKSWLDERTRGGAAKVAYRDAAAETVYREAAAGGDPDALYSLASWLEDRGREAEADRRRCFGIDAYGRTAGPESAWQSY
jgi:TPR repeat protein